MPRYCLTQQGVAALLLSAALHTSVAHAGPPFAGEFNAGLTLSLGNQTRTAHRSVDRALSRGARRRRPLARVVLTRQMSALSLRPRGLIQERLRGPDLRADAVQTGLLSHTSAEEYKNVLRHSLACHLYHSPR